MRNESGLDRILRFVLAIILLAMGKFFFMGTIALVAYVLAVIMLATAATGFCPLYKILGINTNTKK